MFSPARLFALAALVSAVAASAALAGSSAISGPSGQSHASTSPGTNGRIAFKRYSDAGRSTGAIFTIGADGSGQQQVTHPQPGIIDDQPDWSSDGSLIAFSRCAPDLPCAIYTVKQDGSEETRVTACPGSGQGVDANCEDGQWGSFLPDGKRVVYTHASGNVRHFTGYDQIQHSEIVVNDVGGAKPRVLIGSRPYEGDYLYPAFSPDGSQFVYVRGNSPLTKPALRHAIFVARADGSGSRRITPWSLDAGDNPDWAPSGRLIVFRSFEGDEKQSQIYVVRPDGSGLRAITHFKPGTTVLSYSFSPDGRWIVFAKSGKGGQPDIFVMRTNGSGIRPVTNTALWDSAPDWGTAR